MLQIEKPAESRLFFVAGTSQISNQLITDFLDIMHFNRMINLNNASKNIEARLK